MILYNLKKTLICFSSYLIFLTIYSFSMHESLRTDTLLINVFWFIVIIMIYVYYCVENIEYALILHKFKTFPSFLLYIFSKLLCKGFVFILLTFISTIIVFELFEYQYNIIVVINYFLELLFILSFINISFLMNVLNLKSMFFTYVIVFLLVFSFIFYPLITTIPILSYLNILNAYYSNNFIDISNKLSVFCYSSILVSLFFHLTLRKWNDSL